jgi:hypothetical protein
VTEMAKRMVVEHLFGVSVEVGRFLVHPRRTGRC